MSTAELDPPHLLLAREPVAPDGAPAHPRAAAPRRLIAQAAGIALILSVLLLVFGPPGVDRAAHIYHTDLFRQAGWQVWNNYWYAGRYELVNYSILFYPLAALVGLEVVACLAVTFGAAVFAALMGAVANGRGRLPALVFAATWPTVLLAGQYPFALAAAFALLAALALVRGHNLWGLALALLAALTSPLAFLLLAVAILGAAFGARGTLLASRRARVALVGLVAVLLAEVVVLRTFPVEGHFPFPTIDVITLVGFCLVGAGIARGDRVLRGVFLSYGFFAVCVYAFPSGVGGNFERLADYAAVPLLLLAAVRSRRRISLAVGLLIGVVAVAQAAPVVRILSGGFRERADSAAFWSETIAFLKKPQNADPSYRVEAVATFAHSEALHLAGAGIPLTRGWFRQDDFPINEPLYTGDLKMSGYEAWLRSLGVRFVVLPRDELDYSAQQEAAILDTGLGRQASNLRLVHRDAYADVYELADPTPIVTSADRPSFPGRGPAVLRFTATSLSLWLPGPGTYDVRVRYTPFWESSDPSAICIGAGGPPRMTRIVARRGGPVTMTFDLTLAKSATQALGGTSATCPPLVPDGSAAHVAGRL